MRMFLVQSIVHWYWILAWSWGAVISFPMWNHWLKDGFNGRLSWPYRPWCRLVALGVIGASIRCKQSGREAKSTILHTLRTGFEVNADNNHAKRLLLCLWMFQSIGTLAPKRHIFEETMADCCEKGKFHTNRQQHHVQDPLPSKWLPRLRIRVRRYVQLLSQIFSLWPMPELECIWYSVYIVLCTWPRLTSPVCLTSNKNDRYDLEQFSIYSEHPSWLFHFTGISREFLDTL